MTKVSIAILCNSAIIFGEPLQMILCVINKNYFRKYFFESC